MNLLQFTADTPEPDLRQAIVEVGQIAYQRGLLTANDGNISVRLPNGNILITPAGLCKGRLAPEDLLIVSPDGHLLYPAANPHLKPTSEQPMHLESLRQRPDIRAVLHAHPPYAVALSVAGYDLRDDFLPEVCMTLRHIPTTQFALPSSPENAVAISQIICHHNALLLRQHGSLTVGQDLEEALTHLERLEHVAKVQYMAQTLGQITSLPEAILLTIRSPHACVG
ncbi:MAG: class II aldolase/adducin family protein [Phormidesmis sp. CAN_BIN36]|nr:class II aldolase/adducin family protein [Phormidesmis sp. CAN_BIN36]